MEHQAAKRPRLDQRYCPHCYETVSYKTYRAHKRLYYNIETNSWFTLTGTSVADQSLSEEEDVDHDMDDDHQLSPLESEISSPPSSSEDCGNEENNSLFSLESPPISEPALSDDHSSEVCDNHGDEVEVWSDREIEDEDDGNVESPPNSQSSTSNPIEQSSISLVRWLVGFLLLLQAQFHLSSRVLDLIFRFMKTFLIVIGRLCPPCAEIGVHFPMTIYMAKQMYTKFKGQKVHFQKYPVCKKCGTVWKYEDCVDGHGSNQKAKLCSYIPPLSRGLSRKKCNAILFKTVELASGRKIFYPLMTYCYIDLQTSLQNLLLDKNFTMNCSHWKSRNTSNNNLGDVYDGRVWKSFLEYNGRSFLSDESSYAFMINIDWFQPYKHLIYSVGAIYLTVFNLPRPLRYNLQNVCLVGILPGPHEPELTVNSYIDSLVKDLKLFWDGVELNVCNGTRTEKKVVRCAIICCSCDLPAGRKLCGFLGHSAHLGCSKCMKYFPSTSIGLDRSGFDRENWVPRTNRLHRYAVSQLSQCTSKSALRQKESELGCRYSSLLDLPYFDAPTMLVIDPMHNLFLGVAKHFVKKIFIENGVLSGDHLKIIQQRVDKISVPPDIGRIPQKIQSSFHSFTADQYKNWVIHYSIICLHDLLSPEHLECWRHFVLACRLLCKTTLEPDNVTVADALLLQFCRRSERLFGKNIITPNMHMSCHLRDCILDYGPLNHFWLFAFERFNGILGQLPNNNRSIEVQMMKRFLSDTEVIRMPLPSEFEDDFKHLINSFQKNPVGTLGHDTDTDSSCTHDHELPHSCTRSVLEVFEVDDLIRLFTVLHSSCTYGDINLTFRRYSSVRINGKVYGSFKSRSKNSSIILAELNEEIRPARIDYFAQVSVLVNGAPHVHLLARLSWFEQHVKKDVCGKPVTVWEHDLFELQSFVPTSYIKSRTVSLVDHLDDVFGSVLFVSPYD